MTTHKNQVGQAGTGINGGEFARKTQTDAPDNVITVPAESQILREFLDEYNLAKTPDHQRAILDQWITWTDEPDEDAPWVVQERSREQLADVNAMLLRYRLGDPAAEVKPAAEDVINSYIATGGVIEIDDEELVILSHAEGDFDASQTWFESIELYREGSSGNIYLTAVTDLDLHHLDADTDWLEANTEKIAVAVAELYPGAYMQVSDLVDNAEFRFDVTRGEIKDISTTDAVALASQDLTAARFSADVQSDELWSKIRDRLSS